MANNHDIFTNTDKDDQLIEATKFEKKIEDYLIKNNIKYKTQEMLSEEQIKKFGQPISTPDFYIIDDLYINDKKIKWIDAKNFYGAYTKHNIKNITKQATKYLKGYGNGGFIFNLGYSECYDKIIIDKNIFFLNYQDLL